jgi:hypothetical protein
LARNAPPLGQGVVGLLVYIVYDGAGEVKGQGEDELSKLVARLDLGLNLRVVCDKKTTIKLNPSQPEIRKSWANINFETT